ncbi:hypothetical protein ACA578_16630 [Lactiplantibacillus plantarum]|uniref:hypothetical protein n=1 Tax=Lactiplantibacillus plantarum TaxID=1590 RepID=UPI003C1E202A
MGFLISVRINYRICLNKKPVYIYFICQTMSGTVKEFVLETDYQDALGKDLDIEALANTLAAQD